MVDIIPINTVGREVREFLNLSFEYLLKKIYLFAKVITKIMS